MAVDDEWVIKMYGKKMAKNIIKQGKDGGYITPVDKSGRRIIIPLDTWNITRVKYCPQTHLQKRKRGEEKVVKMGIWKGVLEDGTVSTVPEETVTEVLGEKFVRSCKEVESKTFVTVPTGLCRSLVMIMYPKLRRENAPPVKYMQGETDSCVSTSLASAFHHTGIPDLVRVAKFLQNKSIKLSGGVNCLKKARDIVVANVNWLQPKRLPMNFDWQNDINDYMFVVAAIEDDRHCCQHAVTIFRNWIYDSNEPYAFPLSKESLDCCTWELIDDVIDDESIFVRFVHGWIFQELQTKRNKFLDKCKDKIN